MGLEAEIWASRLRFGLEGEWRGGTEKKEEEKKEEDEKEEKFLLCESINHRPAAQKVN